ncbi:MAG: DUF3667 domain-containing protein [Bacteroidetes bacterium]|nr:DUF3667 domain-containing protein [Bacteroidota bacterium]
METKSPETEVPEETNIPVCKNCESEIQGHYCHFCGQRYHDHKEGVGELVYEFISDFVHFDSRFFKTVLPLIFKPGKLTKSYNEGKQRSQFHPIRLYMFSSFLYFLLFFAFNKVESNASESKLAADSTAKADSVEALKVDTLHFITKSGVLQKQSQVKYGGLSFSTTPEVEEMIRQKVTSEEYLKRQKALPSSKRDNLFVRIMTMRILKISSLSKEYQKVYSEKVMESFMHNIPKTLFFLLPFFALLLKLLYVRHKEYFFVDHAILSLHFFSFIFLLLVLSNYILGKIFNTDIFTSLSVLWIFIWILIAMKKIYAQSWVKTFSKFIALGFIFTLTMLFTLFINLVWSALML